MKKRLIIYILVIVLVAVCSFWLGVYWFADNMMEIETVDTQAEDLAYKANGGMKLTYPVFAVSFKDTGDDLIYTMYSSASPYRTIITIHSSNGIIASVNTKRYNSSKLEAKFAKKEYLDTNVTNMVSVNKNVLLINELDSSYIGKSKESVKAEYENAFKDPKYPFIVINY